MAAMLLRLVCYLRLERREPPKAELALLPMAMLGVVAMAAAGAGLDGHHDDMAVADAAFGNDTVGERFDVCTRPSQHRDFQAAFLIDVHMQGGLREVVVLMEFPGQSLVAHRSRRTGAAGKPGPK